MIRIVRKDAKVRTRKITTAFGSYPEAFYLQADTVLIDEKWRPEEADQKICSEIVNGDNCVEDCDKCNIIRMETWQACLKALGEI